MEYRGSVARAALGAALILTSTTLLAQGNYKGLAYTSLSDGGSVNQNIYTDRIDVYANGGRNSPSLNVKYGLPDGIYYFQVTTPKGVLLSKGPATSRQLWVINGVVAGYYIDPETKRQDYHRNGEYNPVDGSMPVELAPFDETADFRGDYVLWLIRKFDDLGNQVSFPASSRRRERRLMFSPENAKTDRFKVFRQGAIMTTLGGMKFYDTDADGVFDPGEPPIAGVRINVYYDPPADDPDLGWILYDPLLLGFTTSTALDGTWIVMSEVLDGVAIKICEVMPETGSDCDWHQTMPDPGVGLTLMAGAGGCWLGTTPSTGGTLFGFDFGNVCLCPLYGGHTMGYWHNSNGEDRFTEPDRLAMVDLCLRNVDGSHYDPADHADLSDFLVNAEGSNAYNMANMLSAQLAALVLTVRHFGDVGFNEDLERSTPVFLSDVPGLAECYNAFFEDVGADFRTVVTVGEVIDIASALLCDVTLETDGKLVILGGHSERAKFECIKDIIDAINNNRLRSPDETRCAIIYP
ncbi:MAG: hypothetical protein IH945_09280 [Armatimonadetes bacterium]|nr:hypothetical protein [Armatimonadota bacterium]